MRILAITWGCDLEDVSESEITARWVKELAKDHEVTVFAVSRPERYGCVGEQFPELDVIEWMDIRLPSRFERFQSIVKPGYLLYYVRARRFLKHLLRAKKFDIIHHLSPFSWRYPSPASGLGVPLVKGPVAGGLQTPPGLSEMVKRGGHGFMFLRNSDRMRLAFDPLLRSSYRTADHVLLAAPYVGNLLKPLEISSASIEIEHGLAVLPERQSRAASDQVHFLFVGRVIPTKGVRFAIRALARSACREAAHLTVVGDGDELAACRAEAARLGLEGRVHFHGWLTKPEVAEHYRRADVFVFPSFREPTGGVLLEAMSFGLPVITCAYGGPDYMVDDGCGIKVVPGTQSEYVEGIAKAMDRLALDPILRARSSENAYRRAKSEFGWEAKRKRLGELYRNLAG